MSVYNNSRLQTVSAAKEVQINETTGLMSHNQCSDQGWSGEGRHLWLPCTDDGWGIISDMGCISPGANHLGIENFPYQKYFLRWSQTVSPEVTFFDTRLWCHAEWM